MLFNKALSLFFLLSLINAFDYQGSFSSPNQTRWMSATYETDEDDKVDSSDSISIDQKEVSDSIVVEENNSSSGSITHHTFAKNSSTKMQTIAGYWPSSILNYTYNNYYNQSFRNTKLASVNNLTIVNESFVTQPYTSTCLLKHSGSEYGSCFLLSNGYALTAAHCVYIDGKYTSNITATFTFNSGTKYSKTVKVTNTYIPLQWKALNPRSSSSIIPTEAEKNVDWAILKFDDLTLPKTFGATTIASNTTVDNSTYYITLGYPSANNYKLTYSLGKGVISKTDYRYDLYANLSAGMSGGPLIALYDEYDNHIQDYVYYNYIIGINSTGEPDTYEKDFYAWSGYTRITNTMIDIIGGISK